MKKTIFTGSAVALVTPFKDDEINYEKLGELIECHITNKTDALVVCGSTGEAATLSEKEHLECLRFSAQKVDKRIPIIAGVGSNNTKHAIHLSQEAEKIGVDALLSVVPYYNKPTQDGIYAHFKSISESVSCSIIIYNVPSRTVASISPETVKELSKLENIVGIKECVTSNIGKHVKNCTSDFSVYSGEDGAVLPVMALGAKGVVSVAANIIPAMMHELTDCAFKNDINRAREIQLKILDLVDYLFVEPSPTPIKTAMNHLGMEVGECRLPLTSMTGNNKKILTDIVNNLMKK